MADRKVRTIIIAVDEETGKMTSGISPKEMTATEARDRSIFYATVSFPNKNYWYKATMPLYKGSRLSIVLCSPKKGN